MRRTTPAGRIALLTILSIMHGATSAYAAETGPPKRYALDIPSADVEIALIDLARRTRHPLIVPAEHLALERSNAVRGRYSLSEALSLMLKGTSLTGGLTKSGVITIAAWSVKPEGGQSVSSGKNQTVSALAFIAGLLGPTGAHAAQASDARGIEEIIVTAQKRSENLQEVPVSVQVISSQQLALTNQNSLQDLARTIPSVYVQTNGFGTTLRMRGVGQGASQTIDAAVVMFEDDIYHGKSRLSNTGFLDVERLEVLRGPQTTFFGNNAIAGALNIITKKPGDSFSGSVRALYGEFGQYALEGAAGGPITDKIGIRVAATGSGVRDGWIDNVYTGETVPKIQDEAGRITLTFTPNDDLDATLKVQGSRHRVDGAAFGLPMQFGSRCPPPAPFSPTDVGGGCAVALAMGVPIGLDNNKNSDPPGQGNWLSTFENVLTINYRKWDHTFTSVTGFLNYTANLRFAPSGLPVVPAAVSQDVTQEEPERYHQFTQELRVASPADQPIEYVLGGYYQADQATWEHRTNFGLFTPFLPFLPIPGATDLIPYTPLSQVLGATQASTTKAVFGSISWNVTDSLKLTAGLRGSWVDKTSNPYQKTGTGTTYFGGFRPFPTPQLQATADAIFGLSTVRADSRSDSAWTPSAKIQYQINPEAMAYFSYSRGFLAGAITGPNLNAQYGARQVSPEYVNAYEIGLKSEWFNKRVLINIALFRSDYRDLQVDTPIFDPAANTFVGVVTNAASSQSQGVELEGQWLVTEGLRLWANVTYLDSKYVSYPNGPGKRFKVPGDTSTSQDLSGTPLPLAPQWSGNISVSYAHTLWNDYRLTTEVSPYFTTSYTFGGTEPIYQQPGYVRWDARVTFEKPDQRWAIDLIGKNLSDEIITPVVGLYTDAKQMPRNFAFQLRYSW